MPKISKTAYAGTELFSNGKISKDACDELASAAGYTDYAAMSTAIAGGITLNASKFGSYAVTFCDMDWWPVGLSKSGEDVVLTLWLKTSIGNYTFSDGTYGNNATYAANNYRYSWIRSAINMGQTSDNGDYYGSWPNSTNSTTAPKLYTNSEPSLSGKVVAPTAVTTFSSIISNQFIIPGGDCGDAIWLPSVDEAKSGGTWGCTSTQWAGTTIWTRSPSPSGYTYAYYLNTSGGTNSYAVSNTSGVRPAINLRLAAPPAAEPEDVEKEYKGTPFTIADITGSWYDSTKMQIDLPDDMTNVGSYQVKVTLTDDSLTFDGTPDTSIGEDEHTRYFTFTITPKPVQISWATQNHEEGSGADSFYFLLPSLNVTAEVMSVLSEVKYYQKSDYNTSTGVATGSPVTAFEQGKDYVAVTGIKDGLISSNYSFSGNPYYAFNTTDNRTTVVVKIENSGETYDGKQHAATANAEKTDGTPLVTGTDIDFLLTYYKDGDPVYANGSTVAPTNAGTYKLVVSIKPAYIEDFKPYDSMEFEYVIEKADPVCNPVRKDNSTLYTGADLPEIVTGSYTDTAGTYTWDAGQKIVSGESDYNYTFTPNDTDNYNTVTGQFKLTGIDANVKSISAEFNLPDGVTIYDSFSLDDLMPYLKVSGVLENGETIDNLYGYTITGTLTEGDSTLTVHYGDKDLTCQFTVENVVACVFEGITADFSQDGNVYTSTELEDLKAMLTVKGKYNDGRDYGAIDGSDYDLIIDTADGNLIAGVAEITVSYWNEGVEYTTTFKVTVKTVVLESISAVFNPGLNEIKSSTSLEKLKNWLTVTGTNNDGSDFGEISADDYTLTGTLKSGTASTITVKYQGKSTTFTVDVAESVDDALKTPIPVPELKDMTYTGNEINVLQGWAHSELVDITGSKYTDADTYTLTLVIKDPDTYKWDTSGLTPVTLAKTLAGYALAEEFVGYEIDGDTLTATWTIAPAVLKGTWNASGTLDVVSSSYKGSTDGLFNYHYFDANGNEVTELVEGEKYTVTAELIDTKNFVLDETTTELLSAEHGFTVPTPKPSGMSAAMQKAKEFFTGKAFGVLPVWSLFLIGLLLLILLIIIIAAAKRRSKNKEEREAKKEAKEEEKRRREEERQMHKEKLEAERELAKAKQEAELEKIRAQAGLGMAGMGAASMAMQQPVQSAMGAQQQPQPQPAPQPVYVNGGSDNSQLIAEMRAQIAEMRAENKAAQAEMRAENRAAQAQMQMQLQQQYGAPNGNRGGSDATAQPITSMMPQPQLPAYGQGSGEMAYVLAKIEAELAQIRTNQIAPQVNYAPMPAAMGNDYHSMLAEERAKAAEAKLSEERVRAEAKIAEERVRTEERARAAEQRAMLAEERFLHGGAQSVQNSAATGVNAIPADIVVSLLQAVKGGNAAPAPAQEKPAVPPDAVITTTTTVDRSKNNSTNFDVDGFYDDYK